MGRSLWAGAVAAAIWLLGAGVAAGWLATAAWSPRQAVALALLAATGAWAAAAWWRQPSGRLDWDGAAWCWWPAAGVPLEGGSLRVAADLQFLLLVQWSGAGRRSWLWLERRADPSRWAALRRAVYSRADPATQALTGAPPPSARP